MHTTTTTTTRGRGLPYYQGKKGDSAFKHVTKALQRRLAHAVEHSNGILFDVGTKGLWEVYLSSFRDPAERQYHNCNCCHSFIKRYGGLVTLSPDGTMRSAIWDENKLRSTIPEQYLHMVMRMREVVEKRSVARQYLWTDERWGRELEGGFTHFWADPPVPGYAKSHLSPEQAMADKLEDRRHLDRALQQMPAHGVDQAIAMLEAGGLIRAGNLLPMGRFLVETREAIKGLRGERRNRQLWLAVSRAAPGWCTPRSSAFGALVDDVLAGRSVAAINRSHIDRMDPLKYQRPQAAPAAGNIRQAEQVFEKMGLESALRRRPCAVHEIPEFLWQPFGTHPSVQPTSGVFSHVQPKSPASPVPSTTLLSSGTVRMTFAKFQRDILPQAISMKALVVSHGAYCGFITAVVPDAQPLFKWDLPNHRNPVSWYLYVSGSSAYQWNLTANTWVDVLGLTHLPPEWGGGTHLKYLTDGRVLVIMRGAKDRSKESAGLFPECLRTELHHVRATIEAHARSAKQEPLLPGHSDRAAGLIIDDGSPVTLEVTMERGRARYLVDRLE